MRLLICAGGTGGGVYPALAVLQAKNNLSNDEILWIGSDDGIEKDLVERAGIRFCGIPSAGIHGVSVFELPARGLKLLKGYFAAKRALNEFKPDVMFFTGGYTAVPVAMAGNRIPSALFIPDIEPGMALQVLIKGADLITVVGEKTLEFLPKGKRSVITGYPTRKDIQAWERGAALSHFGLSPEKQILFVFGGSKGARSINQAVMAILPELLKVCQVIHVSGKTDWDTVKSFADTLTDEQKRSYKVYPYLHEDMGAAFSVADLVVSRSGASTMGELPIFGVPAVLVPYPYAWRYQKTNADFLVEHGGAELLRDESLKEKLLPTVQRILSDSAKLSEMKSNMSALAKPEAARKIADLVQELGES